MSIARDPDFYLQQANYVRSLARRLVYDRHAADDLFQAAWLAALQRPPQDTTSPRRWLARIVRNLASKAWLRAARRERREAQWQGPQPTSAPSDVLAHEHERQRVIAALLELDEPYRAALIARFFDGLEPSAIAARDGVPVETVRTRIKRGLERLRERLLRGEASARRLALGMALGEPDLGSLFDRFLHGVLLMSATKKVVAAVVVLLAVVGWWVVRDPGDGARAEAQQAAVVAPARAESTPGAVTAAAPVTEPERDAVAVPDAPDRATTGSLVVLVQWADRRPAADVVVLVHPNGSSNFEVGALERRTDREGRARFDRLAAGPLFVRCDRGAYATCAIGPGVVTDVVLAVERGVLVRGRVYDIDGRPAAGAQIHQFAASQSSTCCDTVVARSDAEGGFTIVDGYATHPLGLSARMAMRAPTPQVIVSAAAGAVVDVELRFVARGGAVGGRVLDGQGRAVAGACVQIGPGGPTDVLMLKRGSGAVPARQTWGTRTDAEGRWLLDGLAAGEQPVLVVAEGKAPWNGQVSIVEQGRAQCDAVLVDGVRLEGVVRDERGAAVASAEVFVGDFGLHRAWLRTAKDGSYSLTGLPLGAFTAHAKAEGAGEARAEFVGVTGATLRWDAVLTRAITLRGRVVRAGAPVAGAQVRARCMPSAQQPWYGDARTDGKGAFVLTNCPDALLHLDAYSTTSSNFVVATRDDVAARSGDVVLEVDLAREPNAFCIGRVVDPDGRPVVGAEVTVLPATDAISGGHALHTDDDGRFRTPACPAGDWYAYVKAPGWPHLGAPRRTLAPEATVDFGELRLVRGHAVAVALQAEAGIDVAGITVALADANCTLATGQAENGVVRFANVGPGDYTLVAYSRAIALRPQALRVGAGPETAVVLPITAGSEVMVEVREANDQPVVDRIESELFDGNGACIDRTPLMPTNEPLRWAQRLVAGSYEIRLRDHRGRVVAQPIVVPPGGEPVRVVARLP